jgi:hypothetical protein
MTRALSYVEIDVPAWTQTSPDSPETESTLRFAVSTDYLPNSIPAIPSITDITVEPTTISLGQDLGQRAVVTVTFRDHRHVFDGEEFSSGTFWGKFRARYGLSLQGNPFRLIRGTLGQALDAMETRHYLIDSTAGPNSDGSYQIIAKDIFSLATGDKAQAPALSNGALVADIAFNAITMTLTPTGIASEYPTIAGTSPAIGYASIGGTEVVAFSPSGGDVFGLIRGQFNTTGVAHAAGERVQLALYYSNADPADIIYDLLVNYAGIDPDFIPIADWRAETAAYLPGVTYTALIADPRPVDKLIAEIIEQASLAVWWDDINQSIRLQVLQPISTALDTYDQDNTLAGTLEVMEQPEKRLSEVQVYYTKINPLVQDDEINNYSRTQRTSDDTAVTEYGSAAIKRIMSRWIPNNGATTAETLSNKQLARFRDPPRRVNFHVMRDQMTDPQLGGGYELGGTPFQDMTGVAVTIPIQITRLNPTPDHFEIEAEEMLWTPFGADIDPTIRAITISSNTNNVNLRDLHDAAYSTPTSGDTVNCIIQSGVIVGSVSTGTPAFDVGTWPVGVTVTVTVNGRIQGCGGGGGNGGGGAAAQLPLTDGTPGDAGGTALYTRQAISLTSTNGQIWAGGGGGGGTGALLASPAVYGGYGGCGGAGTLGGSGGSGGFGLLGANGVDGEPGNSEAGGTEGSLNPDGGGPGQAGTAGGTPAGTGSSAGGAGGAAGASIDGDSFVTDVGAPGDILGAQIN